MNIKFDDILPEDESMISKETADILRLQVLFSEMESYLGVYKSKFPETTLVQEDKQFVITYTGKDNVAFSDFITEFCLHFYDGLLSLPPGYYLRLPGVKRGKLPYTFKLDITSTATDEIEHVVSKYIKLLDLICDWRVESDISPSDTMDSVLVNVDINNSLLVVPTLKKFIKQVDAILRKEEKDWYHFIHTIPVHWSTTGMKTVSVWNLDDLIKYYC